MKNLIFGLFLFSALSVFAQLDDKDYPPQTAFNANYTTLASLTSTTLTNTTAAVVGTTNRVDESLYHTVQAWCSTTNNWTVAIEGSLDKTNFVQVASMIVTTNTATSAITTFTGKYGYLRVKSTGTNIVGGINHLGGR